MDEADLYSDEVAIINRGKIVKTGTASELKRSLHSEIISFRLANNGSECGLPAAASLKRESDALMKIRTLNLVEDAVVHDCIMDVAVENGEVAMPLIIDVLRNEGISLEWIRASKPTLDDVFLKYAGMRHTGAGGRDLAEPGSRQSRS
jgi:ABC-2 type transport system ATP-binding protein